MKKLTLILVCVLSAMLLSSCGLMEDAFKAGFIIALVIAAIVGLLIWILHILFKALAMQFPAIRLFFQGFINLEDQSK